MAMERSNKSSSFESTATGLLLESRLTRPLDSTKEDGCFGKGDRHRVVTYRARSSRFE